MASAWLSWSCVRRPLLISTEPRRFSRRWLSESAPTTLPSRNVTVTVSSFERSVSTPVFRCSPMSWKMSARLKSFSVPSSAISRRHFSPQHRRRHEDPDDDRDHDRRHAHDDLRRAPRHEHRRETPGQHRQRHAEDEEEHADRAGEGAAFQELAGAGDERAEKLVPRQRAALIFDDLVELLALRRQRDAVALQIDVDALRAVRGALARRLAAVAERAAALDARAGEARAAALDVEQRRGDGGEQAAERQRVARADERIEPGVVAEERAGPAEPRDGVGLAPGHGDRRPVHDDLLVRRREPLDVAVDALGLVEHPRLVVEVERFAAGDGVVVERNGEVRIELLGALILVDRRRNVVVEEVEVADVDVRAGALLQLERAVIAVHGLRLVALPELQGFEHEIEGRPWRMKSASEKIAAVKKSASSTTMSMSPRLTTRERYSAKVLM